MEPYAGACVFEPETYFRRTCSQRYPSVCNFTDPGCLTDNIGCILYPLSSRERCESTVLDVASFPGGANPGSFRGVWYDKARTRSQCEAYGCGYGFRCHALEALTVIRCLKSGEDQGFARSSFISSVHSNNSYCSSIGSICVPFYEWTQARWLPATWRYPLQWLNPATHSAYQLSSYVHHYPSTRLSFSSSDAFDWAAFSTYIEESVAKLYAYQLAALVQCNRATDTGSILSVQRVACLCSPPDTLTAQDCLVEVAPASSRAQVTACGGAAF